MSLHSNKMLRLLVVTVLIVFGAAEGTGSVQAQAGTLSRWSFTIQGAAKLPQDVWVSALGSNSTGWQSGGSICLGVPAQGF
jgi:hypothetical protein